MFDKIKKIFGIKSKVNKPKIIFSETGEEVEFENLPKSKEPSHSDILSVAHSNIIQAMKSIESRNKSYYESSEFFNKMFPRTHKNLVLADEQGGMSAKGSNRVSVMDSFNFSSMSDQYKPSYTYDVVSKFNQNFIGYQNCAILMQNPIISNACSVPAEDAMSNGYKFYYKENNKELDEDKLITLQNKAERDYNINEVCVKAERDKAIFGYTLVVPTFNFDIDMSKPLDINKIPKGSFTGLTTIEPYWLTYELDSESLTAANSKYFYQPTYYVVTNGTSKYSKKPLKKIHRSWCIKRIYEDIPTVLKPTYYFGGVSLTQMIFEAVYCYEKALNELLLLLQSKRTVIADGDMANYAANQKEAEQALMAMATIRDNFAVVVKEVGTEVKQIETTLNGLEEIVNALFQRVAMIAKLPVPKLLKTPLKGFNSTGDFEKDDYRQYLKRIQKEDYVAIIEFNNMFMTQSEEGKVIDIGAIFNPNDNPSEIEKSQIRLNDSLTMTHRLSSGLTDFAEERKRLANDPNGGFTTLDADKKPEIDKSILEKFTMEKNNKGVYEPREKDDTIRPTPKEDIKTISSERIEEIDENAE